MARRLVAHHWMMTLSARVQPPAGPINPYDLFGVTYVHRVPVGTVTIDPIDRVDMFARFFNGRGTWEFEVEVVWVDGADGASSSRAMDHSRSTFARVRRCETSSSSCETFRSPVKVATEYCYGA